jgi:hypothetical protein
MPNGKAGCLRLPSPQAGPANGTSILDNQVSSVYPAVVSQPIKQRKLGLIEGLPAPITDGKKAKPTAGPLRPQARWRNEQRRSSRYELPPLHSILIKA